MTKAIRIHETGGPEVLRWEDVEVGAPGPGQARVKHSAVGLNYLDTYQRSGLYPLQLPITLGMEGAGVVEELGEGVSGLAVGDRVAYAAPPPGSYSVVRLSPADRLVKLPDAISDQQAAAMMLQGMTVQYLIRQTHRVQAGETVLFHAAAGGVGLIACQWLKHLGVTVIGTVGSAEKAALAKAHGCTHTINYRDQDFVEKVKEITGGDGVAVAYDSVGKDTFEGSLQCLAPLGLMVTFGNASGPVPALRARPPGPHGLAVHHSANADDLYRQARRPGGDGGGAVRGGALGHRQDRGQPDLSARRNRPGPPRPGSPQDHGEYGVIALNYMYAYVNTLLI